eukprot:8770918-Pyramimonas_sp.AAC.1
MTAMWEVGLFDYEDFVTARGDRILTFAELQRKHGGRELHGKHGWALGRIASQLGCDPDGTLPVTGRRACRAGQLDTLLGRMPATGNVRKRRRAHGRGYMGTKAPRRRTAGEAGRDVVESGTNSGDEDWRQRSEPTTTRLLGMHRTRGAGNRHTG